MHMTTLRRNYNRCISGRKTRRSTTKAAFWLRMYNRGMTAAYRALGMPITCVHTRIPRDGDVATLIDLDCDPAEEVVGQHWTDADSNALAEDLGFDGIYDARIHGNSHDDLGNGWDCEPDPDERD